MIDQLIIGEKASFDDYGASLAKRNIGMPKKKVIKETVPFSNKTYDFSAINGELYWEERELEYIFEMTAETPEELEEMKAAFSAWVMPLMEANIYDPFIEDYHFVGTFNDLNYEDDEGVDKTTATVKFTAYPYKVANLAKTYTYTIKPSSSVTAEIVNNSNHRVIPTVTTDGEVRFQIGLTSVSASEGEYVDAVFMLGKGMTSMDIFNPASATSPVTVTITFSEEIL